MHLYSFHILCFILFFGDTSTVNSCSDGSTDSSGDHCIEVEDSTTILTDEGVTFLDQISDHSVGGTGREIDNQEDENEGVLKWYPETLSNEESPFEVGVETTPNTLSRKFLTTVQDPSVNSSSHIKEKSVSARTTNKNDLHAADNGDVRAVREKKDLSIAAKSVAEDRKPCLPVKHSATSGQKIPLGAEIIETLVKPNSSLKIYKHKSESLASVKNLQENEHKSEQMLKNGNHSTYSKHIIKTGASSMYIVNVSDNREMLNTKENTGAHGKPSITVSIRTDKKADFPSQIEQSSETETVLKISKVESVEEKNAVRSKVPADMNLKENNLTVTQTKSEENAKESISQNFKSFGSTENSCSSSSEDSTVDNSGASTSVSEPKFEKQSMSLDLLGSMSTNEEVEDGGWKERREKDSTNYSSKVMTILPGSDVVAQSGGENTYVPATSERLVADNDEGEESTWSKRTREEHAQVVSRFLAARTSADVPAPTAAAQFQRRPSRLSESPPELVFPSVPQGDSFHIQELGLSDGVFLFSYLGSFLSLLQPAEFPIELIRDALWSRVSLVSLITQSLRVEAGFLACLVLGVLTAVALPCYVAVHACCSRTRRDSNQHGDSDWDDSSSSSSTTACRRRALLFVLYLLALFIGVGVGAMFATNEQMSSALGRTPRVLHTALTDATTFLRNSNRQLRAVITESLDRSLSAASDDLDNVELLLGEPIQNELAVETGVDVALDTLVDVGTLAAGISGKVGFMLAYSAETRDLVSEARDRLHDLRQQVDSFRRQCPSRDRPLCETVDPNGLDAAMRLDQLLDDRRLGEMYELREANLSTLAQQVKTEFQRIPQLVEDQTRDTRIAVRRQLSKQRTLMEDEVWSLDAVTRDLSARVEDARDKALLLVRGLSDLEYWRWLLGLGASVAVLVMWLLMLAGLVCGCCGAQHKAAPTLLASVVVASLLSLALWLLALGSLVVGGHGEVFICRPLYDEPQFPALTSLLDQPGVVFRRGPGFFSNLLYGNDTLDVPLREVLMECQDNRPSYKAFKLRSVYDVNAASDHRTWDTLHEDLSRLQVNLTGLQLLTPDLQRQLTSLVASASVNLTAHRLQLSRPVTGKDLSSFSDQLESVANQIKDLATASRMETLAARTRRLLVSHIQPLEQRKEDLVYQLTALEVQMQPLQRQVNQSLSHLKTIQYFINNQGDSISKQKTKDYVRRLLSYMDKYRDHVMQSTSDHVAPCKPIWDVYHAMRQLLCRHILDPLNGWWFSCVWCLVMFLAATPACLKLAKLCRDSGSGRGGLLQPASSDSPSEALMMPDSNAWSSNNRVGESDGW